MANIKKVNKTDDKSEKIEEKVINVNEDVKVEEPDKRDEEINELKNTIIKLQEAMQSMLLNQQNLNDNKKTYVKEDEVEIGTYFIQGIGFTSTDKSITLAMKAGDVQALTMSEMKKLLRQPEIRKLFEEGTCYFVNKEDYDILSIHKINDLSTANLQSIIYSKDYNYIVDKFNKMTSFKKNASVTHCLIYKITDMIRKGELTSLDYNTQKGMAEYFGLKGFERGIKTLNDLDAIKG